MIIPIPKSSSGPELQQHMFDRVAEFKAQLESAGVRVETDYRTNYTPGWKYNHWELKGLPLRCELGPKDMENQTVVLVRRDTGVSGNIMVDLSMLL